MSTFSDFIGGGGASGSMGVPVNGFVTFPINHNEKDRDVNSLITIDDEVYLRTGDIITGDEIANYPDATVNMSIPSYRETINVDINTEDSIAARSIDFAGNGMHFYVYDDDDDKVVWYTLTSPYDIRTRTKVGTYNINNRVYITDIHVSNDGKFLVVCDDDADVIESYTLSTDYDISTYDVLETKTFENPVGVSFSYDGLKMFVNKNVADTNDDYRYVYRLDNPYAVNSDTQTGSYSIYRIERGTSFSEDIGGVKEIIAYNMYYRSRIYNLLDGGTNDIDYTSSHSRYGIYCNFTRKNGYDKDVLVVSRDDYIKIHIPIPFIGYILKVFGPETKTGDTDDGRSYSYVRIK